ncbi:hypothetical protein B0H11DRAFT_2213334 [Mycena galericulata]|nr:hypothetical protein B0H11DRAFT_2213334 [Mycena galericulata]
MAGNRALLRVLTPSMDFLDPRFGMASTSFTRNRVALYQRRLSHTGDLPLHLSLQRILFAMEDLARFATGPSTMFDYSNGSSGAYGFLISSIFRDTPVLWNVSVITPDGTLLYPTQRTLAQMRRFHGECSISLDREFEKETESWMLSLPNLVSLRLHRGERHGPYLDFFILPALETLELAMGSDDVPHFLSFTIRSFCVLPTFHLVWRRTETTIDALQRRFPLRSPSCQLTSDPAAASYLMFCFQVFSAESSCPI